MSPAYTTATSPTPPPSPQLFMKTMVGIQRAGAVWAAVEFDLFTAIGEGIERAAALATRCRASERGMRILCDYLTAQGFLAKSEGRYRLTAESAAFRDRRSPAYMGSIAEFLANASRPRSTIYAVTSDSTWHRPNLLDDGHGNCVRPDKVVRPKPKPLGDPDLVSARPAEVINVANVQLIRQGLARL